VSALNASTAATGRATPDRALPAVVGVICGLLLIVCAAMVIELTTAPVTSYAPTVGDSPPSIVHPVMIEPLTSSIPTPAR